MPEDDEGTTENVSTRWQYTNDVLAGVLLTSLPVMLTLQALDFLPNLSRQVFGLYALCCGIAAVWAFGEEAIQSLRRSK